MTQLEVRYRYVDRPTEREMRAIDAMREVYGIRRIAFDEKERVIKIEFDEPSSRSGDHWFRLRLTPSSVLSTTRARNVSTARLPTLRVILGSGRCSVASR